MPYVSIKIPPGIKNEGTSLSSDPTWYDSDNVRFKSGIPEKIGGWKRNTGTGLNSLAGVCRSIHTWRLNSGLIVTALGTSEKLYLFNDSTLYDITPLRAAAQNPGTDKFSLTNLDATVTVTHTGHGSADNAYVTIAGFTSINAVDAEVNTNHQISVVDANTYTFEMASAATGTDAADGGASVTIDYEIDIGNESAASAFGYGAGPYGLEAWGDERTISGVTVDLRHWSMDSFGEDLVTCPENGRIYTWAGTSPLTTRATVLSNSPLTSDVVIVTNPDRHLVALSTEINGSTHNQLAIAWATQETKNTWTPTSENTAGTQVLSGGSVILAAERSQNSTLIWTDTGLHSMTFIGPPLTFSFNEIGTNCGAVSNMCVVNKNTTTYWMGSDDFFLYDGVVKQIPCSIHRSIFKNFNRSHRSKVYAGLVNAFDEVWWFYPSDAGTEIDKYAVYNYVEGLWFGGSMVRSAWSDSDLLTVPIATSVDGTIYEHETGVDDDTSAMTAYIESAEFDMGEGEDFMLVDRLIPDMTITTGSVDYIVKTRRYPHSTQVTDTTSTVSSSTEKVDLRIRARQLSIKIESDALLDDWRYGIPRYRVRADGKR